MNTGRKHVMAPLGVVMAFALLAFCGCGSGNGDNAQATPGPLAKSVDNMETRTDSHYGIVTGLLSTPPTEGTPTEPGTVPEETWDDILEESEDYTSDMTDFLENWGESVTDFGNCHMSMGDMMMGGRMMGSSDFAECPWQPYMDGSFDEIQEHMTNMGQFIDEQDTEGIWEEMQSHWQSMQSHMQGMGSHMGQYFGDDNPMDPGDEGEDWDITDHMGGGMM